ncbi:MAG TPA: glycosyltransferase [Thermoanaerobaculia bacterium]|nr:glycosyltransferase [Thermoanaerobaculia bacterium]
MKIVILGLSITSSWGNGHATTYRALVRELAARGHEITFLERDVPWYAAHRDLRKPPYCATHLYGSLAALKRRFRGLVRDADAVIVGSYVPEGIAAGEWVVSTANGVTAFYDIDTPVTMAALERGQCEYLAPELIPRYDLYLSFTGGPILDRIERQYGSPAALPLYCSVDPALYFPERIDRDYDLGYLGTYSDDRQPTLRRLLLQAATRWRDGKFVVAGPQYPETIRWPKNVTRIDHIPPDQHRAFYNAQRFTLNVTRAAMIQAGYAPSVRLFEAAACGVPIISDAWPGLETIFEPGREILVARTTEDALAYAREMDERERHQVGKRARQRVLREHTAAHRAAELESHLFHDRLRRQPAHVVAR